MAKSPETSFDKLACYYHDKCLSWKHDVSYKIVFVGGSAKARTAGGDLSCRTSSAELL